MRRGQTQPKKTSPEALNGIVRGDICVITEIQRTVTGRETRDTMIRLSLTPEILTESITTTKQTIILSLGHLLIGGQGLDTARGRLAKIHPGIRQSTYKRDITATGCRWCMAPTRTAEMNTAPKNIEHIERRA